MAISSTDTTQNTDISKQGDGDAAVAATMPGMWDEPSLVERFLPEFLEELELRPHQNLCLLPAGADLSRRYKLGHAP